MESCFNCGGKTIKNASVKGRPKRKCVACGFVSRSGKRSAANPRQSVISAYGSTAMACHSIRPTAVMHWVRRAAKE